MSRVKPAHFLSALAWLSAFAILWLNLFDLVDSRAIFTFLFSLAIAVLASGYAMDKKKDE